jgi:hypothetical protein
MTCTSWRSLLEGVHAVRGGSYEGKVDRGRVGVGIDDTSEDLDHRVGPVERGQEQATPAFCGPDAPVVVEFHRWSGLMRVTRYLPRAVAAHHFPVEFPTTGHRRSAITDLLPDGRRKWQDPAGVAATSCAWLPAADPVPARARAAAHRPACRANADIGTAHEPSGHAHGVVAPAVKHRSGACCRRDRLCGCVIRRGSGGGHAVASEAMVVGADGVRLGMPSGTVWAAR